MSENIKYCSVHPEVKMKLAFNKNIYECYKCKIENNNELLKRSFLKQSSKDKSSYTSKLSDSKGKTVKRKVRIPNISKQLDKQLNDAWSLLVKLLAGNKCEYCGKTKTLNSHHIFSRKNKSTKWDTMNGICLCVKHHTFDPLFSAHMGSVAFNKWLLTYKGEKFMNKLEMRANNTSHYAISDKQIILNELLKQIEAFK